MCGGGGGLVACYFIRDCEHLSTVSDSRTPAECEIPLGVKDGNYNDDYKGYFWRPSLV